MEKDGRSEPLYLERNSLCVEAHVLELVSRSGYVAAGTAVADELMDDVNVIESHASSSAEEPPAEVASTPAPALDQTLPCVEKLRPLSLTRTSVFFVGRRKLQNVLRMMKR